MLHKRWLTTIAFVGVLTMVAAACAKDKEPSAGGTTGAAGVDCATVEFGCVEVAAGAPIRFGSLLAISGDVATLGVDSNNGITLAIDYLDGTFDATPGTILDHPVEVQEEDDLCSKEGGQAGAQKLAADPTITAVVGTSCSSSALGVADTILAGKGIVLISPSNTAAGLTSEEGHQPFYLRTAQNDAIQAKVVADFVYNELGFTKAATVHDESPYAAGLTGGFKDFFEAAGGTVTAEEQITSTDTDFHSLLTSIAQTSPELIYSPDFNPACALIAKQAKDIAGLAGVELMGSDGCAASTFFDQAGDAANGFYLSGPIPSPSDVANPTLPAYQAAYKEQFGNPTADFNPNAFDAMTMLAAAVEKVAIKGDDGSLQIPRGALKDAMFATTDYAGISGVMTCIATGDCASGAKVNIGVYKAPDIPIDGGNPDGKPVFTEQFTLSEALGE